MFSLANDWGWCDENPTSGVARFHEDRRERWLTVEELQRLTAALDAYSDQRAANALRLLMLTGARENEVLKADWSQFDLKRGIWTKPSHHTKQQRIEHVPLSAPALELLEAMKSKHVTGALFPGANGKTARVTLQRPWRQICKAAGLVVITTHKGKRRKIVYRYRPNVRIHDLRHTFASQLVSDGVSLEIVGKLLGHTQPQTTWRYAHVADEAQRRATNRFGEILSSGNGKEKR
jgi:integrase